MTGKLYIVATPIGNLCDISERALETLRSVDLILAEDTRVTRKLLSKYDIKTRVVSYHHHSGDSKKFEILQMLEAGENIALVTDAGTPGVSDPGNELLDFLYAHTNMAVASPLANTNRAQFRQAEGMAALKGPTNDRRPEIEQRFEIIPIPGPSALTVALSICGFNTSKFIFAGFFPKKKANKWLNTYFTLDITTIYFDSPYRLIKNLEKISDLLKERRIFVARELTKLHEETYRGTISEVIQMLKTSNPKGEVVVIVEP